MEPVTVHRFERAGDLRAVLAALRESHVFMYP
jgi:hypothetical protein